MSFNTNSMVLFNYLEDELCEVFEKLKNKRSSGYDGIPAFLVLHGALKLLVLKPIYKRKIKHYWRIIVLCPLLHL